MLSRRCYGFCHHIEVIKLSRALQDELRKKYPGSWCVGS